MRTRRRAREAALKILFQMDFTGMPIEEAITNYWSCFDPQATKTEYANMIARGVAEHLDEVDAVISKASLKWRIERISCVDRNVLRIGAYGLLYLKDPPVLVTINEAIELGKLFGSEESSAFINGVLDHIAR